MFRRSDGMVWVALAAMGPALVLSACTADRNLPVGETLLAERVAAGSDARTGLWFVELQTPPVADGGSLSVVTAEKSSFRHAAKTAGISFEERYAYDTLFNGLSIAVSPDDVERIASLRGVKAVYPVLEEAVAPLPSSGDSLEPDMWTALAQTGADVAQDELGLTGAGVRVGIIDTGIDYLHPDLGGCFGPGCKVGFGWDFVDDDPDPYDCYGHGTAVMGVLAGEGEFPSGVRGVAPGVTIGAYRVADCSGSARSDRVLAALERALADGVDVVNISLGSDRQWPQFPNAAAATRLVNHGVVVVASQGNSADTGLYGGSAPAVGDKVIACASVENTHRNQKAFSISPDDELIGYVPSDGVPAPTSGTLPMKATGTPDSERDACDPLPPGSLSGYAALIRAGACYYYQMALNAQNAGAGAVIIYHPLFNTSWSISLLDAPISIPVVLIDQPAALEIYERLQAGPVSMTWTDQVASSPLPPQWAGLISNFSSYGPSPDLAIKPNVSAPGNPIRTTYLGNTYISWGGTSFAAPFVSGAVALLLQARPHTSAAQVEDILQTTASPVPWSGGATLGLEHVHRQGAGMLQVDKAILTTTRVEPSMLPLGESELGPAVRTLAITNDGPTSVTYDLSHRPALATGPSTFSVTPVDAPATVQFSSPSVIVPAGGTASVHVTITAPGDDALQDLGLYGGYIAFVPRGGGSELTVPYLGLKGDYQQMQTIGRGFGLPYLMKVVDGQLVSQAQGATYTLANGDYPVLWFQLAHHARRVRWEVFDANSGRAWGRAFADWDYAPRSPYSNRVFGWTWHGRAQNGGGWTRTLPDGAYVLRLSATKALGDEENPADVEHWTSPIVTITGHRIGAPTAIVGTGADGSLSFEVDFGYKGAYSAEWAGLTAPDEISDTVTHDPNHNFAAALATCDFSMSPPGGCVGITWHVLRGGAGLYKRVTLEGGAPDDLDLYVFDGNHALVGSSTTSTAREVVAIEFPESDEYFAAVHAWDTEGASAAYTLRDWNVVADEGNATLSGAPSMVQSGTSATLTLQWSNLAPGALYMGAIHHDDYAPPRDLTLVYVDVPNP